MRISPRAKRRALLVAAHALNRAAEAAFELATREERRRYQAQRAAAERIVAHGLSVLEEYLDSPAFIDALELELILDDQPVPDRLTWARGLWGRLGDEANAAISEGNPERARRAVSDALRLARMASPR
jgi:hypothetical protein